MSGVGFGGTCGIGGAGKSDKVITGGASKALPERCKQKKSAVKKTADPTYLYIFRKYSCTLVSPSSSGWKAVTS
mgnify:CR=1 FL=1